MYAVDNLNMYKDKKKVLFIKVNSIRGMGNKPYRVVRETQGEYFLENGKNVLKHHCYTDAETMRLTKNKGRIGLWE